MLRKKPSINTVNLISYSLQHVISSSSSSYNKTLILAVKTSSWVHHLRRSSTAAAQRFDFFPPGPNSVESDISPRNQLQQQYPSVFSGENYSGNSSRYQRSDFGSFQPPNSSGVHGGSSDSYQRSDLGDARSVNPNGFYRENSAGYPTRNLGGANQNSGFHGEFDHGGNAREGQNSGYHGEFSHGGNAREGQNSGFHGGNARESQNSGFHGEFSNGRDTREGQNSGFHGEFSHGGNAREGQNSGFHGEFSHGGHARDGQNYGFHGGNARVGQNSGIHGEFSHGGITTEGQNSGFHGGNAREGQNSGIHGEFSHGGNAREGQNSGFHGGNTREGQNSGIHGEFSHGGNAREGQNSGFHGGNAREGQNSGIHGEFSHGGNAREGQNSGFHGGNTRGNQNSGFHGELNLGGNTKEGQNSSFHGELSHGGNLREGDLPTPMGTSRQSPGNSGEFQQAPFGQNGYQNSYGYNRANVVPGGQQDFGESHFSVPNINGELPNDESAQNGESYTYKGTLDELDEFSNEEKVKEAVEVLNMLEKNGVIIDLPRYLKLLKVCGDAGSLEEGRIVHDHISRVLGEVGIGVHNKILDMYSKCGSMDDAFQLFNNMPQRNLTSWDTMITGLATNNLGEEAIDLFLQFHEMGLRPDEDLFVAVFRACGVLGAVKEGMLYFDSMKVDFGIAPTMKHYVSIVDMLGRSGHLDEALEFIEMMPIEPSCDVWESLMNFCRVNGYEELGNRCAEIVEDLDSSKLTEESKKGFLTVKTSTSAKIESAKKSNLLRGRSHIHEYRAGDRSNPEISEQIKILVPHMKEAGYVPDIKCVLHDVDEESREEALLFHSERLATAYGLMTSPARSPIRIIKNLRVCRDCHNAMKIMSKIVGRLLIARDAKRFHHFENGVCSCKDFW